MKTPERQVLAAWIIAGGFFLLAMVEAHRSRLHLENPTVMLGWTLFAVMVGLSLFNTKKKLSMLPLGSSAAWLLLHSVGGILALALFWLHTGVFWPAGFYERVLAGLFYLITVNGIIGYILQRIYPSRLAQSGLEVIYERIPSELAQIRERAEKIILECTEAAGSDTLAQHYMQTLDWFFRQPRFFLSHALSWQKGTHWVRHQCTTVRRYLNQVEAGYLDRLALLAETKNKIDYHYAAQNVMKGWLLIHVPLASAVMALVVWHLLVVHVYAL